MNILYWVVLLVLGIWFILTLIKLHFALKLKRLKSLDNIIKLAQIGKIEGQNLDLKALAITIKEQQEQQQKLRGKRGFFRSFFSKNKKEVIKIDEIKPTDTNDSVNSNINP